MEAQGQQPLALLPSPHAAVTNGGNYLSLSLSLTLYLCTRAIQLTLQMYQQLQNVCALSHIYTYVTFRLFTYLSPSNRSGRIGTRSSEPGLWSSGSPYFHPEGPVSQQPLPLPNHMSSNLTSAYLTNSTARGRIFVASSIKFGLSSAYKPNVMLVISLGSASLAPFSRGRHKRGSYH